MVDISQSVEIVAQESVIMETGNMHAKNVGTVFALTENGKERVKNAHHNIFVYMIISNLVVKNVE